ncbi:MAG: hypothetical protein AAFN78_07450 [Pseudomonadota bacterium]
MKASTTVSEYRESIDTIDRAIVGLTARINATTYEYLSNGAAREKVRVAHALKQLSAIA